MRLCAGLQKLLSEQQKILLHNATWDAIIWSGIAVGGWLFGYLICITFNIGSFAQ